MKTSLLALVLFAALPLFAKDPLDKVELKWKATTGLSVLSPLNLGAIGAKIRVAKFKDSRHVNPLNKIGENREDEEKGVMLPVLTVSDVSAFVTDNFKEILHKTGITLVTSGEDFVLNGEILEYFVTETNNYNGTLSVKVTLDKGKKTEWQGSAIGTTTRFGRSYKLDNYLEVLSDCVIDFTLHLFQTVPFKNKLTETP